MITSVIFLVICSIASVTSDDIGECAPGFTLLLLSISSNKNSVVYEPKNTAQANRVDCNVMLRMQSMGSISGQMEWLNNQSSSDSDKVSVYNGDSLALLAEFTVGSLFSQTSTIQVQRGTSLLLNFQSASTNGAIRWRFSFSGAMDTPIATTRSRRPEPSNFPRSVVPSPTVIAGSSAANTPSASVSLTMAPSTNLPGVPGTLVPSISNTGTRSPTNGFPQNPLNTSRFPANTSQLRSTSRLPPDRPPLGTTSDYINVAVVFSSTGWDNSSLVGEIRSTFNIQGGEISITSVNDAPDGSRSVSIRIVDIGTTDDLRVLMCTIRDRITDPNSTMGGPILQSLRHDLPMSVLVMTMKDCDNGEFCELPSDCPARSDSSTPVSNVAWIVSGAVAGVVGIGVGAFLLRRRMRHQRIQEMIMPYGSSWVATSIRSDHEHPLGEPPSSPDLLSLSGSFMY